MEATTKEIMATVLARDLVDGEWVEVGANLPVPRAGVLLAHLMWGANMSVMIAMTKANVLHEPVIEEFELITAIAPRAGPRLTTCTTIWSRT